MIQNATILCDNCQSVIAHLQTPPAEDWSRLHNLCPKCFLSLAGQAVR